MYVTLTTQPCTFLLLPIPPARIVSQRVIAQGHLNEARRADQLPPYSSDTHGVTILRRPFSIFGRSSTFRTLEVIRCATISG